MLKKKLVSLALVVSTSAMSVVAMADPWQDHRGGPNPQGRDMPHDMNRDGGHDRQMHRDGPNDRQMDRYPKFRQSPQGRHWQQGDNLPPTYRSSHYRVSDWRSRGLPPPPSGHRWVHVKGEYILVAVASGVIANILLNR